MLKIGLHSQMEAHVNITRISKLKNLDKRKLLMGLVSLPVMFGFIFFFIRGEKFLQAYIFGINESSCIYYEQYGNVWLITFLISIVLSLFLSSTVLCMIFDRKSIKKVLKIDVIFLTALAIALFVTLPKYAYIKQEGIYMRNTYSEGERYYQWNNVVKVNISFYSTTKDGEHIAFRFDFTDGKSFDVKYTVRDSKQRIKFFGNLIKDKKLELDISPIFMEHYLEIINR